MIIGHLCIIYIYIERDINRKKKSNRYVRWMMW